MQNEGPPVSEVLKTSFPTEEGLAQAIAVCGEFGIITTRDLARVYYTNPHQLVPSRQGPWRELNDRVIRHADLNALRDLLTLCVKQRTHDERVARKRAEREALQKAEQEEREAAARVKRWATYAERRKQGDDPMAAAVREMRTAYELRNRRDGTKREWRIIELHVDEIEAAELCQDFERLKERYLEVPGLLRRTFKHKSKWLEPIRPGARYNRIFDIFRPLAFAEDYAAFMQQEER